MQERLTHIAEYIQQSVKKVLQAQGHELTGKIFNDVDNKVSEYMIEGWYQHYAKYVHRGVSSNTVKSKLYNPEVRTGKKTSKYIDALIRFAELRGMTNPKSAAFAIAYKHSQEGMPTKASYRSEITKTGERLGFLNRALEDPQIETMIYDLIVEAGEAIMDNIFEKEQKRIYKEIAA